MHVNVGRPSAFDTRPFPVALPAVLQTGCLPHVQRMPTPRVWAAGIYEDAGDVVEGGPDREYPVVVRLPDAPSQVIRGGGMDAAPSLAKL